MQYPLDDNAHLRATPDDAETAPVAPPVTNP